MTAPTGTSPRPAALRASAKASDMGSALSYCTRPCYQTTMPDRNKPHRTSPTRAPAKSPRPAQEAAEQSPHRGERIAKLMARAGLCSRREAETWIAAGRVAVNGQVLASPALNVTAEDKVVVDGKALEAPERTRLFLFNKPAGLVTTERDPEGRPTVFGYVAERFPDLPRLISVGRLDINTEGLLLLTNDGGLARVLELPATGWIRRYRVRANGETDEGALGGLRRGGPGGGGGKKPRGGGAPPAGGGPKIRSLRDWGREKT